MDNGGITPVMNMGGNGYDGMNSGAWIFGLIVLAALFNGGFGGWGAGRGGAGGDGGASITEALNLSNGQQTAQLEAAANQRQNCMDFVTTNNNINGGFANLARDICTLGTSLASSIYGSTSDIKDRLANVATQQAECCCTVQRGIDSVNFGAAQNTAAINANTVAVGQKILDKLCENEKAQMQARINQLELNQAVAGVVRYPNGMTYNAGTSPFCGGYCCG
jgi:hypothetical protein